MPLSHLINAHQDTQMPGTSYINANFLMLSHLTGFGGFTVSFLKSAKVKRRAVVFQWRDGPSLLHHHSFCSGFPQSSACKMLYRKKNKVHAPSRTSEPKIHQTSVRWNLPDYEMSFGTVGYLGTCSRLPKKLNVRKCWDKLKKSTERPDRLMRTPDGDFLQRTVLVIHPAREKYGAELQTVTKSVEIWTFSS